MLKSCSAKSSMEAIPSVCLTDPFLSKIFWHEKKWNSATRSLCLQTAKHWLSNRKNMQAPSPGLPGRPGISPQLSWCWGFPCLPCTVLVSVGSWDTGAAVQECPCSVSWWTFRTLLSCVHPAKPMWVSGALGPSAEVWSRWNCPVRLQCWRDAPEKGVGMDHSETAPHLTLGWHSTAGGGGLAYGAHDGMMYIWDVRGVLYRERGTQAPWLAPLAGSAQPKRTFQLAYSKLWKGEGESKFLLLLSLEYSPKSGFFTYLESSSVGSTPVQGWRACGFMRKGKE